MPPFIEKYIFLDSKSFNSCILLVKILEVLFLMHLQTTFIWQKKQQLVIEKVASSMQSSY